ncbi:MAG: hypothetical protein K0R59_1911 [Sphingobacterium sp.]|jgi:hypothetical protein|uniref:hypothetical protein n=1 Tax=Sphingobacterium sp. CZ-UAM TaxID=1933868 RepID=UPI0009867154|nr:hypothetical protein [Sphingobacterium sp. CZ-UAM]MDF2516615.1 hypothetical protein [Sphingobacterium sp.]OOG18852.1 hypothetical protein BWD42_02510 [Sphingobacterium sp. CZ-UAM]
MKKILDKIGAVLQVVLAAPLKLPGKASNILTYIALGLGILETVMKEDKPPPEAVDQPDENTNPGDRDMEERRDTNETQ